MSKTIRYDNKGNPRTKGIRNPSVMYAMLGCKGGAMRDRRERRSKDARRQKELYDY